MSKVAYLLVVMVLVFHLSTVADASLASTWEEAKSKVAHVAQDAGKVAIKAVEAVKKLFTGSNDEKPAPVTPKTVSTTAESTFVKTSARNSESSGRSSYSYPYYSGSNTHGSTSSQRSAGFGLWSSYETTTARTYGWGSRSYESTTDRTSAYGRKDGASTYDQYSDDWTSSSGKSRSNNYGSSSYSKGSPYTTRWWYSDD